MAGRFYVISAAGTDSVSELFFALDATVKTGKPPEFRVARFRKELCSRAGFLSALELEVNSETPLNHENILKNAGAGAWEGTAFVAYERTDAPTLPELLKTKKALEPQVVAAITAQLLEALHYAHSGSPGGIRPQVFQTAFTPNSVEISRAGLVKVHGFAVPTALRRPHDLDSLLGRTAYLPPQLLERAKPTPQSDLFSLGILVWELLAGEPLFKRGTPDETLAALRNKEAPAISSMSPLVPAELDSFVARLLMREPTFQFKDVTEAKRALEKATFSLDLKTDAKSLSAWVKANSKPAAARDRPQTDGRKVLAEIVASRDLARAITAPPTVAEEMPTEEEAPRRSKAAVVPISGASQWEKSAKILEDLPEEAPPKKAVPKWAVKALFAVALLAAAGAGAMIFFPDENPVTAPLAFLARWVGEKTQTGAVGGAATMPAIFTYRNPQESSRTVFVQGPRLENAESFFQNCGGTEQSCDCEFFDSLTSPNPAGTADALLSRKFNYVACSIPDEINPHFIRVVAKSDSSRRTNRLQVETTLSWVNVLGAALLKQRVRWINRYACDQTFIMGEGVDPDGSAIRCPPMQHLGFLQASYHFYVFRSDEESNQPAKTEDYKNSICGLPDLTQYHCQSSDFLAQFGLYKQQLAPFLVPVSLPRAPTGEDRISVVGYAAGPDPKGNCPVGLTLFHQWDTEAPTLTEKSPETPGFPNTFVNRSGELNDRLFETMEPRPFVVSQRKNGTPCDGKGDCSLAAIDEARPLLSLPYKSSADICVINASLLDAATKGDDEKSVGATQEAVPKVVMEIHTSIPAFEATVNGVRVPVVDGKIKGPLHQAIKVDISKQGYQTQHFTVTAQELPVVLPFTVAEEKVKMGNIDLDCFPPAEVIFWRSSEQTFAAKTPVREAMPAGKYRITFKTLKNGTASEREVVVPDGKTVTVDHIIHESAP